MITVNKYLKYIAIAAFLPLFGCNGDRLNNNDGAKTISNEKSIDIALKDDIWVYFSLEKGEVIGESDFNNPNEDALWNNRLDWDIALCNGFIRTNGGSSGIGEGGIVASETEFDATETTLLESYYLDTVLGGS